MPHTCLACGAVVNQDEQVCNRCGVYRNPTEARVKPLPSDQVKQFLKSDEGFARRQDGLPEILTQEIKSEMKGVSGQRRDVTVMSIGIVEIHGDGARGESDEANLAIDDALRNIVYIIRKFEGTVDKITSRGLQAVFGLPVNHENDPERAVRAAMEAINSVKLVDNGGGGKGRRDLKLRIGINAGEVVVGKGGDGHHVDYQVIGDTVAAASRLEHQTEPDTILVSFSTYQSTNPIFEYHALEPTYGDDVGAVVQAYQLIGIRAAGKRLRGLADESTVMVGRVSALDKLQTALREVREDRESRLVLVSGVAGIGKTRLINEFRQSIESTSWRIFQGTCALFTRATPYRVVADLIREMANTSEVESHDHQLKALQEELDNCGLSQMGLLPYLLHVMGIEPKNPVDRGRLKLLKPDKLLHQTHTALRTFFLKKAEESPLVIILDDMHWIDTASRDFLIYLSQSIDELPALIVMISRNFELKLLEPLVSTFRRHMENITNLALTPLSDADTKLLVDQLIHEESLRSIDVKDHIVQKSQGNPYYVEELIRVLIDHGGLVKQVGKWYVTTSAEKLLDKTPRALADLIIARYDRLSSSQRIVLQKAAVLGDTTGYELLHDLLGESSEALQAIVLGLIERDFLYLNRNKKIMFKHPLIRETIYNTIISADLQYLHLQIAQLIEKGDYWLPGDYDETLAHHYTASSTPLAGIPYLLTAAEKAAERFANDVSVDYFRMAICLMEEAKVSDKPEYIQARIGLGKGWKYAGELSRSAEELKCALDILLDEEYLGSEANIELITEGSCEFADVRAREGDLENAVGVLLRGMDLLGSGGSTDYPSQWRQLADRLAWTYFRQGRLDDGSNLALQIYTKSADWENDDPMILANICNTLGGICWMRANHDEALSYVQRSLSIYAGLSYFWGMAISYTNLGILHYALGRWQKAVENFERADMIRRDYGYVSERPTNLKNLGEALIGLGEFRAAREKLMTSRNISYRLQMTLVAAYAEIGLARLTFYEGDYDEAQSRLKAARILLDDPNSELDDRITQILILEAMIAGENGDINSGIELAKKSFQIAEAQGYVEETIDSMRVLGILYSRCSKFDLAREWIDRSIDLSQAENNRYSLAKAYFEMGQIYLLQLQTGEGDEVMRIQGCTAFKKARGIFEELDAKYDLGLLIEATQV